VEKKVGRFKSQKRKADEMSESSAVSETASSACRIGEVKQWLAQEFSQAGKEVPDFEYTPRSVAYLHNLATLSHSHTQSSKILATDFRHKASEYRSQGPSLLLIFFFYFSFLI